jgi:hypothetical protein
MDRVARLGEFSYIGGKYVDKYYSVFFRNAKVNTYILISVALKSLT